MQSPPRILECKFTHKHSPTQLGWRKKIKHDLCMDVRHVNILIVGQLQNTSMSLWEAKGCQLLGMRGLVLLGKWSGVWLSGRKEVLINFEKATAQQPQACLLPHTDTHIYNPIKTAHACSYCGSLLHGRVGVLLHDEAWLGTEKNSCKGVKIILKPSVLFYFLDFVEFKYFQCVYFYSFGTGGAGNKPRDLGLSQSKLNCPSDVMSDVSFIVWATSCISHFI